MSPPKTKPKKPRPDFPLHARNNGQWGRKILGEIYHFGVWADPDAALEKYLNQKEDLQAGRVPREKLQNEIAGNTVLNMVDQFLFSKEQLKDNGELAPRTYAEYFDICERLIKVFGKNRLLTDIRIEDFDHLRTRLAVGPETGRKISAVRHGNLIRRVRSVFKFANEMDMIERPIKFGPGFKGPSKKVLRGDRNKRGLRMLEANELRQVIEGAKPIMKAMILLGINCGFGNSDISQLPLAAIDLEKGWINFPRPKTGIKRRCPLWPETIESLRIAIAKRPQPKLAEHEGLVFVTKYGAQFVRTGSKGGVIDSVYAEFAKLLKQLKLNRDNLGFYAIRHTFQTVAGASNELAATSSIMGHAPHSNDMAAVYTERIDDDRLRAVTNHVRNWLWPEVATANKNQQ